MYWIDNPESKKDKIKPKVLPNTNITWCKLHIGPDISFGINYFMYRGVMQLMQPITNPWASLERTNVYIEGINISMVIQMLIELRIIKHYLLEYLEIRYVLSTVPMVAVKAIDPVSMPWVRAKG